MLLNEVNGYQRALQYQALEKAQFGAPHPPGFYLQARPCSPQELRAMTSGASMQ